MITDRKVGDNRMLYDSLFQKIAVEIKLKQTDFDFDYIVPTYHKAKNPEALKHLGDHATRLNYVLNESDKKQISDCLNKTYKRQFKNYLEIDCFLQEYFHLSSCSTQSVRFLYEYHGMKDFE